MRAKLLLTAGLLLLLVASALWLREKSSYRALLHRVASSRKPTAPKALLTPGPNVNARDQDGWTPLHWAAWRGQLETVNLLIEKGADVDAPAKHLTRRMQFDMTADVVTSDRTYWMSVRKRMLRTPLRAALAGGHTEVAEALLERGAGVEGTDALLLWAARSAYTGGVRFLLAQGASVEARDDDGWTPLHWAANQHGSLPLNPLDDEKDETEIVRLLLGMGADANARTTREKEFMSHFGPLPEEPGQTPLHLAASHIELAPLLVASGADVNAKDSLGQTPLHKAVRVRNIEGVEFLLTHGADINAQDNQGKTALHIAAPFHQTELTLILLANGADATLKDGSGETPRDVALRLGLHTKADLFEQ